MIFYTKQGAAMAGYMQARADLGVMLLDMVEKGAINIATATYLIEQMEHMNEVRKATEFIVTKING